jgi:hypothetical protein
MISGECNKSPLYIARNYRLGNASSTKFSADIHRPPEISFPRSTTPLGFGKRQTCLQFIRLQTKDKLPLWSVGRAQERGDLHEGQEAGRW